MVQAIYGKLASTAIEKAAISSAKDVAQPLQQESSFKQMLTSLDTGQEMVDLLGIGKDTNLGSGKMEVIPADAIKLNPSEMNVGLEAPQGTEKIVSMLSEVNKGQMQMDNLVNEILYSGKRFSNQELLAIQAHVFHFAQMTELTVKVAEQGVSSVKTVLNTQVQ